MAQGDGEQVEWLESVVEYVRIIHEGVLRFGGGMPGEHTSALYKHAHLQLRRAAVPDESLRPQRSERDDSRCTLIAVNSTWWDKLAALFNAIIKRRRGH